MDKDSSTDKSRDTSVSAFAGESGASIEKQAPATAIGVVFHRFITLIGRRLFLRWFHGSVVACLDMESCGGREVLCLFFSEKGAYLFIQAHIAKQNRVLPGSAIPIVSPEALLGMAPDAILILPWNLADEISGQLRGAGFKGRLAIAVPEPRWL